MMKLKSISAKTVRYISVMLIALFAMTSIVLPISADDTEVTTETVLSGITAGNYTLVPAFDKDIHQYTVKVDSLSSCPTIAATVADGGDSSKVSIAQAQETSGYNAVVFVKNDSATTSWNSYIITFVTDDGVECLDIESKKYTPYVNSGKDDATASYDKKVWTSTKSMTNSEQSWDLGEVKSISEIRFLMAFRSSEKDVYNRGWEMSLDGTTWESLTAMSAASSYASNLYSVTSETVYVMNHGIKFDNPTYARYIRRNVTSEYNFAVAELFVIGSNPAPDTEISADAGILAPVFSEDVTEYELSVRSLSDLPEITASVNTAAGFSIEVVQASDENNHTATVTVNRDGATVKTYTINVKEDAVRMPVINYTSTTGKADNYIVAGNPSNVKKEYMFDGNWLTEWNDYAGNDGGEETYIHTFEMSRVCDLSQLKLWCNNAATGSSAVSPHTVGFYKDITLSVDGTNWYTPVWTATGMTNISDVTMPDDNVLIERLLTFNFEEGTIAKFIRFEFPAGKPLRIREFYPLGTEKENINTLRVDRDENGIIASTHMENIGEELNPLCAMYDADGKLIGVKMSASALTAEDGIKEISFSDADGAASCRIFYWNKALVPFSGVTQKTINTETES